MRLACMEEDLYVSKRTAGSGSVSLIIVQTLGFSNDTNSEPVDDVFDRRTDPGVRPLGAGDPVLQHCGGHCIVIGLQDGLWRLLKGLGRPDAM